MYTSEMRLNSVRVIVPTSYLGGKVLANQQNNVTAVMSITMFNAVIMAIVNAVILY